MNPNELDDFLHRNKMTGNELASKLGVHWTTISRWRNGHEPIPKTVELALKWLEGEERIDALVRWPLENGDYETENGSRVTISGKHSGGIRVSFDWLEENGCIDCAPQEYPEEFGENDVRLVWHCDYCGGGSAKLHKAT